MNWREMEAAWRRQEPTVESRAELSELVTSFEAKRQKLASTLLVRDWIEAGAGLMVSLVFMMDAVGGRGVAWLEWLAIALVMGVTLFFVSERVRARRARLGAEAPLRQKLEAEIAEVRHQCRLLRRVMWWYVGPLMLAIVLFLCAKVAPQVDRLGIVGWGALAVYAIGCGALAWWVRGLNLRAVRRQLEPRLAELEQQRQELIATS